MIELAIPAAALAVMYMTTLEDDEENGQKLSRIRTKRLLVSFS